MEFKVSVIIPVYNAAHYVEHSVRSALSIADVGEVVLVEDGSKDNSLAVCEKLSLEDVRVKLYRHAGGVNQGAGVSRNLGIQKATSPFVAFLDSDDYYYENRFVRTKQLFDEDLSIDGVYERVEIVNYKTGAKRLFGVQKGTASNQLFRYILRGGYFHTNAITLRKSFLLKIGPFDQRCWPHEDTEIWLRMAYYGRLVSGGTDKPVAIYRMHETNNINNANRTSHLKLWKTVYSYWFLRKIGMFNRLIILRKLLRWNFSK